MLAVNQTHLDSNRILYQWIFRFRSRKVYPQFFKTLHSLPPIQTFIFIRSLLCWPIASLTLRCLFTWGSRMHFLWCSEALFPFLSLPTLHQIGELWHLRGILVSQASDFFFLRYCFLTEEHKWLQCLRTSLRLFFLTERRPFKEGLELLYFLQFLAFKVSLIDDPSS